MSNTVTPNLLGYLFENELQGDMGFIVPHLLYICHLTNFYTNKMNFSFIKKNAPVI